MTVLLGVGICCMARRRQKEAETDEVPLEWFYNVDVNGNTRNAEVNRSTGRYSHRSTGRRSHVATNSFLPIEYEEQMAVCTFTDDLVHENGSLSQDGLSDLCNSLAVMLIPVDVEVGDAAVLENEHAAGYDGAQRPSDTQPGMDSQHEEMGQSVQSFTITAVPQSTTHTHDTEQPPPVPAFDPEILYAQPDKARKRNARDAAVGSYEPVDIPHAVTESVSRAQGTETQSQVPSSTITHYETIDFGHDTEPAASGSVAEGGYEAVDVLHRVDERSNMGARTEQPIPADELYSTPDMSQKRNRRREGQGSMGGEGPKDTPPDTPTAADQLYATPDMSKKQRKQPHVSPPEEQQDRDDDEDDTPPEVPVYQPITFLPGGNRT